MYNIKKNIQLIILSIFCLLVLSPNVYAQGNAENQKRIVNEYGQPIQDAIITSENGKNSTISLKDGSYSLAINDKSKFVTITAPGYKDMRISIEELGNESDLTLSFDPHHIGGSVNLGYQAYARESITGAVSSVTGDELNKTPSNILSETLVGRLPGLTVVQNLAELTFYGYDNYSKTIRGISSINGSTPLIIIDGVIAPTQYIEFISPKEIESVSILKDASATAIYGIQGSSGVIVITTKRGFNGPRKVETYADFSVQQITRKPQFINSARYAELRNEAGERDGLGTYSQYSQDEIDLFRSGDDPAYPNNNWYDTFLKDFVLRQRVGVNVTGGSDKFRYFTNLSFLNQEEPFKIVDEPGRKYDPTSHVNIVNFRGNMDIKFNDYVSGYMRLTGNVKKEILAGTSMSWTIYNNLFYQPPTMYGPLSPIFEDDETELGNQVVTVDGLDNPVYGYLNRSGYCQTIETNVIAQTGLKFDLGFLTEGLSVNGGMAYQTYVRNETYTTQNYKRVVRGSDNSSLDDFTQYKTFENTALAYSKGSVFFYYLNLLASIDYSRRFGDHSIDASAHTFYLKQEKEATGSNNTILPYKRQNFGVSVLYGYKDRYYLKGDLGYSGSEQFAEDNRYTSTPAISAAWIASKEDFFHVDAISLLKLRASYGITGSDQLGGSRFLYLDNIRSDGSEYERGNPSLEAEKIKKMNLGIDLGFLNAITLGFDYFDYKVDNMLISSSSRIPIYQGIPLDYYPKLNDGKMENKGYEISVGFDKNFTKDFSANLQFNFLQAKNKVISINESPYSDDYAYSYRTEGFSYGQQFGYKIDYSNGNGMFNSQEELKNSNLTYSFGTPRVGDFIYTDVNKDGTIDEKDKVPMGYPSTPEQEYSINGGFKWKNWDFSFLFHGVRNTSQFISGMGAYENLGKGYFNDIHLKAWTPERYANGEEILYPALSLSPSTNHVNNDYFLSDRSYLRLRNVELAYVLPDFISQKIKSERIRVALSAQNLFTIDHMRSDYIDPEIGRINVIPPYRVYNIGVSINF